MTTAATNPTTISETHVDTCKHHWVIASPSGARSEGICARCGEHRSFGNVFEDVIRTELRYPDASS